MPTFMKSVYWKSAAGHSWEQSPHGRAHLPVEKAMRAMIKTRHVGSDLVF